MQVPAILFNGGTRERRIREDSADFGTAQEMSPKLAAPLDICAAITPFDRVFDGRRSAGLQHLTDDPG